MNDKTIKKEIGKGYWIFLAIIVIIDIGLIIPIVIAAIKGYYYWNEIWMTLCLFITGIITIITVINILGKKWTIKLLLERKKLGEEEAEKVLLDIVNGDFHHEETKNEASEKL